MLSNSITAKKLMAATGFIIGCFALFLQLYLIILNRTVAVPETIIRYFSFFTILSNLLVVISFSTVLGDLKSTSTSFFSKPKTVAAIVVYIFLVGLIYNLILRFLWSPHGTQRIVDELLHVVMPLFYIIFWLTFVEKNMLQWHNIFSWAIFPFAYCVYTLIRGAIVHVYPYPFLDVTALGYTTVLINCGYILIVFFVLSTLLIAVAKTLTKINMEKLTT